MARFFICILLLTVSATVFPQTLPPYIESAARLYSFTDEGKSEINRYFNDIGNILKTDPAAAARNYLKLLNKHYTGETSKDEIIIPVYRRVFSIILDNPELLEAFRNLYSTAAEKEYNSARNSGSISEIESVARLYLPTKAGASALRHLAFYYLDHGDIPYAQYYLNLFKPVGDEKEARELENIIAVLIVQSEEREPPQEFSLDGVDGSRPVWIGGVTHSTVYSDSLSSYPESYLVFPLIVSNRGITVNSGSNTYLYEPRTGRHLWNPGPYHSPRAGTLLDDGQFSIDVRSPFGRDYRYGSIFQVPAGGLVLGDGFIGCVFRKEDSPNILTLFNDEDGSVMIELTSPLVKEMIRSRINAANRSDEFPGLFPAAYGRDIFFTVHSLSGRQEHCFLVRFRTDQRKTAWVSQVFEASLLQYRNRNPLESMVFISGPYTVVFSDAGFIASFRTSDGGILWKRNLLPDTVKGYGYGGESRSSFRPFIAGNSLIIEWPYKNHITAIDLYSGRPMWQKDLKGTPVWGISKGKNIAVATQHDQGYTVKGFSSSGQKLWEIEDGTSFPGVFFGKTLIIPGRDYVLQADPDTGELMGNGMLTLENCRYPGSIHADKDRLYLINNAGVFAYALTVD